MLRLDKRPRNGDRHRQGTINKTKPQLRKSRSCPVQRIKERFFQDLQRSCPVGVGQGTTADGAEPEFLDGCVMLAENPLQGSYGIVSAQLAEEQCFEP